MLKKLINNFPSLGFFTFSAFFICVVSGIIIALFYDVSEPYNSISLLLLKNKPAVFFRSLHYWSAQLFLIFSLLHIIDHLWKKSERELNAGMWLRLVLIIPVIFFAMLSGFILRGDSEALQAKNIFDSLIRTIPFLGKDLSYMILGYKTMQVPYLHHVATATILIWLSSIDHVKKISPFFYTWRYILPVALFLSLLFTPSLHLAYNPIIKGPWYFLGIQEILHYLNHPVWTIIISFIFLVGIFFIKIIKEKAAAIFKYCLLGLLGIYIILTITGAFFRGENWSFITPFAKNDIIGNNFFSYNYYLPSEDSLLKKSIPFIRGHYESCLACHSGVEGFSPSHNPSALGCSSCHLGNPLCLDSNNAHKGMILLAGNLNTTKITCGASDCHSDIAQRAPKSLMATMSGVVSVDKFVFGDSRNLDSWYDIGKIGNTLSDTHLRNLCASCHTANNKTIPGEVDELSRGGGCSACHINYSEKALHFLKNGGSKKFTAKSFKYHPELSVKINNEKCFGCHSRSSRISTNYEGWHETHLKPKEVKNNSKYRILADGRVFEKMPADVHFEKGLTCIDCHSSYETMGDGNSYSHKEQQVHIRCTDCHFPKSYKFSDNNTISIKEMDSQSQKIIQLRNLDKYSGRYYFGNRPFRKFETFGKFRKAGFPLINIYINEQNQPVFLSKNTHVEHPLKSPSSLCGGDIPGHLRLDCKTCHTAWSPQCIGCHTQFNPKESGWDNLTSKRMKGAWLESDCKYFAEPPTLGVWLNEENGGAGQIGTFIPGMVMSLDLNTNGKGKPKVIFHRLYAPSFSHTIVKKSRTCRSCHNEPLAIGYGRGMLIYKIEGKYARWYFYPKYQNSKYDGLPEDAWLGFLSERKGKVSTRKNVRPFTLEEQKKILLVGACFECHKENEKRLTEVFKDFKNYKSKISHKCILPKE